MIYINEYATSGDVQTALNEGTLLKPYLALVSGETIDYNELEPVSNVLIRPYTFYSNFQDNPSTYMKTLPEDYLNLWVDKDVYFHMQDISELEMMFMSFEFLTSDSGVTYQAQNPKFKIGWQGLVKYDSNGTTAATPFTSSTFTNALTSGMTVNDLPYKVYERNSQQPTGYTLNEDYGGIDFSQFGQTIWKMDLEQLTGLQGPFRLIKVNNNDAPSSVWQEQSFWFVWDKGDLQNLGYTFVNN